MSFGLPYLLGALYCAAAAIFFGRFGVRIWRQEGRPLSQWLPSFGPSGKAGADRSCLMLGIFHVCLFILLTGAFVTQMGPHTPVAWDVVLGVSVFGAVASAYLAGSLVVFNRPRFLVPPHLRAEKGMFPAWRQARRGRRAGAAR